MGTGPHCWPPERETGRATILLHGYHKGLQTLGVSQLLLVDYSLNQQLSGTMPYHISPGDAFPHTELLVSSTWNSSWDLGRDGAGWCNICSISRVETGRVVHAPSRDWRQDRINTIKGHYKMPERFLMELRLSITVWVESYARKSWASFVRHFLSILIIQQASTAIFSYSRFSFTLLFFW